MQSHLLYSCCHICFNTYWQLIENIMRNFEFSAVLSFVEQCDSIYISFMCTTLGLSVL